MIDQHGLLSREAPVPLAEAAARLGEDGSAWRAPARLLPVRWPAGYLDLAAGPGGEPVRRMGVPHPSELAPDPGDLADPVGESTLTPVPFVVRKHADRVILLVTARCHFYCRFCFRRSFPDGGHADPSRAQLVEALAWIATAGDVREVILSGGDPLVLPDERLGEILEAIAAMEHVERVRVHSRAPVHEPGRITTDLAALLARARSPRLVTHFNHAVELTSASLGAVRILQDAGIPVLNQSVLLAGVNDSVEALADLLRGLVAAGVAPYYLHHPDRVPGAARFRLTIERGLGLVRELRARVPEDVVPPYVIDVPDGSGKIPVASLVAMGERCYRAPNGFAFEDVS